jgi:DNA-binding XRE family transcriptional regulator
VIRVTREAERGQSPSHPTLRAPSDQPFPAAHRDTHRLWTRRLYLAIRCGMAQTDRGRFGKRIRQLRLAQNLTQEELAHRAGLHPTYVGGVERGERNVGFDNVLKLARALHERPAALFADFSK